MFTSVYRRTAALIAAESGASLFTDSPIAAIILVILAIILILWCSQGMWPFDRD